MCWLTAHLVEEKHSNEVLNLCCVTPPGDHVFLSVGKSFQWRNIRSMQQDASDTMIIDCWANIACLAQDYPEAITAKFLQWDEQDKQVYVRRKWYHPKRNYIRNMLEGEIVTWDAKQPFE
jgi:hypothetical protein